MSVTVDVHNELFKGINNILLMELLFCYKEIFISSCSSAAKASVDEPQDQWFDSRSWLHVEVSLGPSRLTSCS